MRAHRGGRRRVALSSDVRNDHGEPDRVGRVAGSERLHACGDGSDRGLLVWQVLVDSSLELVLANAAQVKNVPGRKSDVNDATWVSELLAHGLVRASFVPEPAIQQLRGLLRTRKQLVREKASHVQRLQKTLEEANIKIESVLSDVMGLSGRAMIQALIDGESDPAKLAALAHWEGACVGSRAHSPFTTLLRLCGSIAAVVRQQYGRCAPSADIGIPAPARRLRPANS